MVYTKAIVRISITASIKPLEHGLRIMIAAEVVIGLLHVGQERYFLRLRAPIRRHVGDLGGLTDIVKPPRMRSVPWNVMSKNERS